jgi:hypothetical protein
LLRETLRKQLRILEKEGDVGVVAIVVLDFVQAPLCEQRPSANMLAPGVFRKGHQFAFFRRRT